MNEARCGSSVTDRRKHAIQLRVIRATYSAGPRDAELSERRKECIELVTQMTRITFFQNRHCLRCQLARECFNSSSVEAGHSVETAIATMVDMRFAPPTPCKQMSCCREAPSSGAAIARQNNEVEPFELEAAVKQMAGGGCA